MKKLKIRTHIPIVDIELYRGDRTTINLSAVEREQGTPLELHGAVANLHAVTDGATEPVIKLSSIDGTITLQGNRISLHFPSHLTADAQWEDADYDLELQINGEPLTLFKGKLTLQHDITRGQL